MVSMAFVVLPAGCEIAEQRRVRLRHGICARGPVGMGGGFGLAELYPGGILVLGCSVLRSSRKTLADQIRSSIRT